VDDLHSGTEGSPPGTLHIDAAAAAGRGAGSPERIAERLDRLPLAGWHRRVVVLVGLGAFFTFFEVALGSFFGVLLTAQWPLTALDQSLIIGSAFVGEMIGSLLLAPRADRFGRRTLFQINLMAYSALSLAAAFSPNLAVFLVLRVLTGVGLGAELTLVDTYLSELLPTRRRGRYIACSYTLGMLAIPVAGGLSKAATGTLLGVAGWRWLLVLAACGGLAVWLFRRGLPESPRWLAASGNTAEADRVLTAIEHEVGAQAAGQPPEPASTVTVSTGVPLDPARYRRRSLLMWAMWVLNAIGFYTFASIAPIVLLAKGFDLAHSLTYAAMTALGYPLGSLVSVFLTDRFERRSLLIAATLVAAAFGTAFGLSADIAVVIAAGVATTVSTVVQSNLVHIYQTELFHTANRSTAIGIPYAASRLVGALLPVSALVLLSTVGPGGLYTCSALLLATMALIVRMLGPRTTNQRLDAI
jgi:putative MFS transporter